MKVEFTNSFVKAVGKVNQNSIKAKIKQLIVTLEKADNLQNIPNVKKMSGYTHFYRIRISNYRLGFQYKNETITLIEFAHRSRIYKIFP